MPKNKLFIGSSSENEKVAKGLAVNLEPEIECTVWSQGFFDLSKNFLENLTLKVDDFDFAVFIFSPDDLINIRGNEHIVARDNIIFEMGLFAGSIGSDVCQASCRLFLKRFLTFTAKSPHEFRRVIEAHSHP